MGTAPKPATDHTRLANAPRDLGFDPADFDRASRGLIGQIPDGRIETGVGAVWDLSRYSFIEQGAANPETVNPSLWRQAQLNMFHGLFEVAPGVWQARGYDISNITFVEGKTGWIVIDPLTVEPCAKACLDLANRTLGERPVTAVIYTHSHTDHFGGVRGVTTQEDVDAGRCRIIAPVGFMRETIGENVIAGYAMIRRAMYQFGPLLPPGPRTHVDCGLGKAIPFWPPGLIAPTEEIEGTGVELVVDGVRIVFQLTLEAEAPAEMNFFFPDKGWLCTAENCTHNMHNLVPIRGALVRDALKWSKYCGELLELFGDRVTVSFASHHWPRWGNEDIRRYLTLQRDLYRWVHDQTMRLANHGHNATEIAEMLSMAPEFASEAHTTGYYGHLAHNVKAVFQRYLSWYDGNPANLWKLPPVDAGRRYVEAAGGAESLLATARRAFDAGDYRWVAELVNHLVFADPTNLEARELQADAFEQIGYQTESATFRNAFLMGAQELRNGCMPRTPAGRHNYLDAMSPEQLFDTLAVRLNGDAVGGMAVKVNITYTDLDEQWVLGMEHRALHSVRGRHDASAVCTLIGPRVTVHRVLESNEPFPAAVAAAVAAGTLQADGDLEAANQIFANLDTFFSNFPLVEP